MAFLYNLLAFQSRSIQVDEKIPWQFNFVVGFASVREEKTMPKVMHKLHLL